MAIYFSTDSQLLDLQFIHQYISQQSYWAKDIPLVTLRKSIENSCAIGGYTKDHQQIAFARIITDYATFGYLADVFVAPEMQGKGVGKALMDFIMQQDFVPGLRRMMLATADAHGLYKQFGFNALAKPERIMEITRIGIYSQKK